jgi:hypothetical protein
MDAAPLQQLHHVCYARFVFHHTHPPAYRDSVMRGENTLMCSDGDCPNRKGLEIPVLELKPFNF